jgi:DNA-binding transcriptional regulator YhcF (GntR family)
MITIDAQSSLPPFEQVRAQLAEQITSGALTPGTRLPPVRKLATDLGLAANTVARSYRDLEAAGLVETRGRNGTVVSAAGDRARERLQAAAQVYADLAHDLGIAPAEAMRFVATALAPGLPSPDLPSPDLSSPDLPSPGMP